MTTSAGVAPAAEDCEEAAVFETTQCTTLFGVILRCKARGFQICGEAVPLPRLPGALDSGAIIEPLALRYQCDPSTLVYHIGQYLPLELSDGLCRKCGGPNPQFGSQ